MNEKTTVTVVAPDGRTSRLEGETAIVFTVDKVEEFLEGVVEKIESNTAYIGNEIPEGMFERIISSLIAALIKNDNEDNPIKASYKIFSVAQALLDKSQELANSATEDQLNAFIEESMDELEEHLKEAVKKERG